MIYLSIITILTSIIFVLVLTNITMRKIQLKLIQENIKLFTEYKIYKKTVKIAIRDTLNEMSPIKSCINDCRYKCPNTDSCEECIENYFFKLIEDERYWVERGIREGD
jgi:hypothetical protein